MKAWPLLGIALMQAVLSLAHWFIFLTWVAFWFPMAPAARMGLGVALAALSMSFIAAALLGFYFANRMVALLYKLAAFWLGMLNFFFLASCACRLAAWGARGGGWTLDRPLTAGIFFGAAVVTAGYGVVNAYWIRVRRFDVALENLPEGWRGRAALLFSDVHLGHINGLGFCRRIVAMGNRLKPDVVLIPGDLFDGAEAQSDRMTAPLGDLHAPLGVYFSTGNHDEFGRVEHYKEVLERIGVRVLNNEKVIVDGLQIAGVCFHDSTYPIRMKANLEALQLDPKVASVLLNHVPNRLPIVEQAGIGLQLSGHTHGGQVFPFNWLTRRVFGRFTHGLHRFGRLQVYTSTGVGTWGPPMRVGSNPEIVLLKFV